MLNKLPHSRQNDNDGRIRRLAPHDTRQNLWLPAETTQTVRDHLSHPFSFGVRHGSRPYLAFAELKGGSIGTALLIPQFSNDADRNAVCVDSHEPPNPQRPHGRIRTCESQWWRIAECLRVGVVSLCWR